MARQSARSCYLNHFFCPVHMSVCLPPPPQVGLAVVNGQLMAVGGFDGTTYLKTIEVYDPDANTWR